MDIYPREYLIIIEENILKISIITVCFNSEITIRHTIESVLSQTYSDIEYIIIDGASHDSTLKIINEYRNQISYILSEPNNGIYDAMNKGIKMASGEIVGFLNSDDIYESNDIIKQIVDCFQETNDLDVLYGDVVFVNSKNVNKILRYYSSKNFKAWKLRFGWMPPHPGSFIKKKVYQKYGNYDITFKISSDYELFVRLLLVQHLKYKRIDRILVRMRQGGVSTSSIKNIILLNFEILRACKNNGIYTNIIFLITKIPFKILEMYIRPKDMI